MKRKKTRSATGFFTKTTLAANIIAVLLLTGSYLASVVDPHTFWPLAFLGLSYPFLLLLNVLFIIWWLIRRPVFALISAIIIIAGYRFLEDNIGFRSSTAIEVPKSSERFIRVMTYNVHYFKKFDFKNDPLVKDQMLDLIRKEQPDVLCMQEFYTRKKGEFNIMKSVKEILHTDHVYYVANSGNDYESTGLAIFSRFPIKDSGSIIFPNTTRGNEAMYADIRINKRIVRYYNVHFQSIGFQPEDYQYLKEVKEIKTDDVKSSRRIGSRLKRAFLKRSEQVKFLKAHAAGCKTPYIICGDFNDTPVSYAVTTAARGLKNCFREKGSGFGITYNGDFPNFQIDYILTTPDFDIRNYHILDKRLSDHYAVRSDVELK